MNFNSFPVNLSCKLFDILIRLILTYNSEIWFMDDYFSISRTISRSEQSGSVLSVIHCHLKINIAMKRYTINFANIF